MKAYMPEYIGTKQLRARRITKAEYCDLRGWSVPLDEDPDEIGYLVEYINDGKPNHPDFDGYISWSPLDVFDSAYESLHEMSFSHALDYLKRGYKVARQGWNGKDMFIFLVKGSTFKVNREPLLSIYPEGTEINYRSHLDMKTVDGSIVTWVASQTDLLANDWYIV